MIPLVALVFLLIRGGSGQLDLQPTLNEHIGKKLNEFRQSVANGSAFKSGGHLPSSMSMFPLTTSTQYEMFAYLNSMNCVKGNMVPPTQHVAMNFFSISYLPSSINSTTVADFALSLWEQEPYMFGIGNDVMYTNSTLQEFANIVHYKTTQFGCHYTECDATSTMPQTKVLLCLFNNPPKMNEPLYVASQGQVNGCNTDSDCEKYVPFSKCTTTASAQHPYQGLCYMTNDTTFITSTTEAAPTSTVTMDETSESSEATSSTTEAMSSTSESASTAETTSESSTESDTMAETSESTEAISSTTEAMPSTSEAMATAETTSESSTASEMTAETTEATEATPSTTEAMPSTSEAMATAETTSESNTASDMTAETTEATEATPSTTEAMPSTSEAMATAETTSESNTASDMTAETTEATEATPSTTEAMPSTSEAMATAETTSESSTASDMTAETTEATEATPSTTEAMPSTSEAMATAETTPESSTASDMTAETTEATEATPSTTEAMPSTSEAMATAETTPESSTASDMTAETTEATEATPSTTEAMPSTSEAMATAETTSESSTASDMTAETTEATEATPSTTEAMPSTSEAMATAETTSESSTASSTMAETTTTEMASETTEASSTSATESSAEPSTTPTATNPITQQIRDKVIFMHNFRRSRLAQGLVPNGLSGQKTPPGQNIFNMSYSTDLETEAQKYADNCPSSGSPAESRNNTGENFGTVSAGSYYDAVFQAIKSFWYEIKLTDINKEMLFTYTLTKRQKAPLRFTQMAWANTYEVGCGAKLCGDKYVVVCRYNPSGNILWEKIYEPGKTCSDCTDICTTDYLTKGLCPNPSSTLSGVTGPAVAITP